MKNPLLEQLIKELKTLSIKQNVNIWKTIATELESSSRRRRSVSVEHIQKHAKKGEIAVVPGKVLGADKADVQIAAFQWSASAGASNNIFSLQELMKKHPKGEKCRIIG